MIPPKGAGFELLNKNLLHDCVDSFGANNILRQAERQNISVRLTLERGCEQIDTNYKAYLKSEKALPPDAAVQE